MIRIHGVVITAHMIYDRVLMEPNSGCWLWTGDMNGNGYGRLRVGKRRIAAHRVAYKLFVGPIHPRHVLDHKHCQTRCCVNPDHMEPVTGKVNTLRGKGPTAHCARKTHCLKGHEFTKDNTYRYKNRRECRACKKERDDARLALQRRHEGSDRELRESAARGQRVDRRTQQADHGAEAAACGF